MKQLTKEERLALSQYRFERAHQTIEEAEYMRKGGYYNAAVNRLYYACFYAASGLLMANDIAAATHSGVKTLLSKHFVKTGLLSYEHGATFSTLFGKRHSGDYEDFVYCDAETVDFLLPKAVGFINAVEALAANGRQL